MLKRFTILLANVLFVCTLQAQWLEWENITATNLTLTSVANSDDEEKDMEAADLNNDGFIDVISVRKEPFSTSTEPAKSDLLLMNTGGALVDQTSIYAPEFISNPTFARDLFIGDFDGDGWKDVIIANTFDQLPLYYSNKGNDANGNWLGLVNETATRFPQTLDDAALICAVKGGDVNGDGFMDIYFANYKQAEVAKDFLFINDGNGNFTEQAETRLGELRNSAFGTEVELKDIDNDGDTDVIKVSTLFNVAPWNSRGVFILYNNGGGTFTNWQNISQPVSASPYMIEIEDFNSDGLLDVFVVDDGADYLLTASTISANSNIVYTSNNINSPSATGFGGNVHAMDLDLDGDMDIGVADVDVDIPPCNSNRRVALVQNTSGVFNDPYGTGPNDWATNTYDFCFFDVNNDGLPDLLLGKCEGYDLFLSNNCDLAPINSDFDLDGISDACDPCPTNPDPNCIETPDFPNISTGLPVPRYWNELLLESIRRDLARPTVHARNLFHSSIAMWDAWAIYNQEGCNYLLGQTVDGYTCAFDGFTLPTDIEEGLNETISYAMYRILMHRFGQSPQSIILKGAYNSHMNALGYDINVASTNYQNGDPAALGNYIAQCIINYGLQDKANEQNDYANLSYQSVNDPLIVDNPGNPTISDRNRWQPLTLEIFIDQSGNVIPGATPDFLSPEWGQVSSFALTTNDLTTYQRDGFDYDVYHDPGSPPYLEANGGGLSNQYKWGFALVASWSAHLDPDDGVSVDISPATTGNTAALPTDFTAYPGFYDQVNGGVTESGHPVNPVTGQAYASNIVPRGDYTRVLAEFWADGPESETPPGHWFTILNENVADHPLFEKRFQGQGAILDETQWYIKAYFVLGGAMHDSAISAWGVKGWYDYIRPVSALRAMAEKGQSSNVNLPSFDPEGLPLLSNYIELVNIGDPLAGAGNVNVGKVKLKAWRGHDLINNVDTDVAGVGWVLAENWEPYQRQSFVTPPFAGYVSGHSTYSRAAAEALTLLTGNEYFPGGMATFTAPKDEFLVFENGPSVDVELQWATYRDASDQCSLSRIWGGIHPPADDIPGRLMGQVIGVDAFNKAFSFFEDNNNNGQPDLCDNANPCDGQGGDSDGDGICNNQDNCPNAANTDQSDSDNDGIGDACDTPSNGDCDDVAITPGNSNITITDLNAPIEIVKIYNSAWQVIYECAANCNATEVINNLSPGVHYVSVRMYTATWQPICDILVDVTVVGNDPCQGQGGDSDGDGVCNNVDNCPNIFNATQLDSDNDGIGDVCDTPSNGDCDDVAISTTSNSMTITGLNAPIEIVKVFNSSWQIEFECTADCNTTEILNNLSPGVYHLSIVMYTANWQLICEITPDIMVGGNDPCQGQGGDSDGDGICNNADNCPSTPNANQLDTDNDGAGDACDTIDPCDGQGGDSDGDGICNNVDNCPNISNANQTDVDNDGIGDVCDTPSNGNCDDVTISTTSNSLAIAGLSAPIEIVKVFNDSWQLEFECTANCNTTELINNLSPGVYHLSIVMYTANWQLICEVTPDATIGGNDPCAGQGGDSDGDGICNNVDNCPNIVNASQVDSDNNGIGDACDAPPGGDCSSINVSIGVGSVTVSGLHTTPISQLLIFTNSWQTVYNCSGNCDATETVPLNAGTYFIFARLYDAGWTQICEVNETILVNTNQEGQVSDQLFFGAEKTGREVSLYWVVNTDYKTDYFEVEHSLDGVNFDLLEAKNSIGESRDHVNYQGKDVNAKRGDNYYRIKQVFEDGAFVYSPVRKVFFEFELKDFTIYPNPAQNEVFVNLNDFVGSEAVIRLHNSLGQEVASVELDEVSAEPIRIATEHLNAGVYVVSVKMDGDKMMTELLVLVR